MFCMPGVVIITNPTQMYTRFPILQLRVCKIEAAKPSREVGERDREMRSDAGSWGDAIVFKRWPHAIVCEAFFEWRSIHRLSNGRIVPERWLRFMLRGAISHPRSLLVLQMEGRINRGGNVGKYFQFFVLSHKSNQSVIHRFVHTRRYINELSNKHSKHIDILSLFIYHPAHT